jgi:NCS2 family nucleobase:cation symporter-2
LNIESRLRRHPLNQAADSREVSGLDIYSLSLNSLLRKVGSYLGYTVSPAEIEASERKKPANLIYDVDEVPPVFTSLMLSAQHVFVMVKGWILVVVFVTSATGSPHEASNIIRLSMIASGLATMLQALRKGPIGSGYLCPCTPGTAYLAASIVVGRSVGLPAVFGLTTLSGLFEATLSRLVRRLRSLFPPEVTGLVVTMVGIELISIACPRFFGYTGPGNPLNGRATLVGFITLSAMLGPSVWGKGKIRLYPVLLGLVAGFASALTLGVLTWPQLQNSLSAPLFSVPHREHVALSLVPGFILTFLVVSLSSMLKTIGDITLCQKINNANWRRTEMGSVSGGILVDGLCSTFSGLAGVMGQTSSSSNVGLTMATGVTSRSVAYATGLILIFLAFFPKLAAVFADMPSPVMGAVLIYVACFMIVGGFQVITSRMLDTRKTFVVAIPMIIGLSVGFVPEIYQGLPPVIRPLFASSLAPATIMVVALNLLFRIGIARRQEIEITPGPETTEAIFRFMENQGAAWGMRQEVATKACYAIDEVIIAIRQLPLPPPTVRIAAEFDEFKLETEVDYEGPPIPLPETAPTADEVMEPLGEIALAGFLIRQHADKVKVTSRDGHSCVHLHFEH